MTVWPIRQAVPLLQIFKNHYEVLKAGLQPLAWGPASASAQQVAWRSELTRVLSWSCVRWR
jgi:hypothetical protein